LRADSRPMLSDLRTTRKSEWLTSLEPLPQMIEAYASAAERRVSNYRDSVIDTIARQGEEDTQAASRMSIGAALRSLAEFKAGFAAQMNSTDAKWASEYSTALDVFRDSILSLQQQEASALTQLENFQNSTLDAAEKIAFDSKAQEIKRLASSRVRFDDSPVSALLRSANDSLAAVASAGDSFKQVLLRNMKSQTKRTQQAEAQITAAMNSGAAADSARIALLATAESNAIVSAQGQLDTFARDIGMTLNRSDAKDLASKFQASMRNLQKAQISEQVSDSARADIRRAALNASLAAMKVSDSVTRLGTLGGKLVNQIKDSDSGRFAKGVQESANALTITGAGLEAIGTATAQMIGEYAGDLYAAGADRSLKEGQAARLTDISGNALGALLQAFQAQTMASTKTMTPEASQAASQQASIAGLITLFGSLVDSTVNVSTSGYRSLTDLEGALSAYITQASQNASLAEQAVADAQMSIATKAVDAVKDFDRINNQVVSEVIEQQRDILAEEQNLEKAVANNYKDYHHEKEKLQVDDSVRSSSVIQDLHSWLANIRMAIATDLKSFA